MSVVDFQGNQLGIGDEVVFISAPNTLQKGLITGFKPISKVLTVVEIVVTTPKGGNHALTAAPFVCALVSGTVLSTE